MIEFLAIPGWQTPPTTLDDWVARLSEVAGKPVEVERAGPQGAWIEVAPFRLRGFAVLAGPDVEAINFELNDPDPSAATSLLGAASSSLGWELHEDDDDDEEEEEDNE